LEAGGVEALLLDLNLPDSTFPETLLRVLEAAPDVPVIVLTALDDFDLAATAVQQGAQDYLVKAHLTGELLVRAIRYAIERKRSEAELKGLNESLERRVAERTEMLRLLHDVAAAANRAETVEQALDYVLRRVLRGGVWRLGHAYLPCGDDPRRLKALPACGPEPSDQHLAFRLATLDCRWPREAGLPGRVLASGKPYWTTKLPQEWIDPRHPLAARAGLQTALLLPVVLEGQVVAAIELLAPERVELDQRSVDAMTGIGTQLGHVIQRERAERQRKRLEREITNVAVEEQQRIGQDLHDGLGQELTALGCLGESLRIALRKSHPQQAETAGELVSGVRRALKQVRMIAKGLVPVEIDGDGLRGALDELAQATENWHGIRCELHCPRPVPVEDNNTATQLYRIAQEAVTNAVKHGRPKTITIHLDAPRGRPRLSVCDDGEGIQPGGEKIQGSGLRIMRYRANVIGAALDIRPADGGGTIVLCALKQDQNHEQEQRQLVS
jgi:signal transduction histidine kinase